MARSGAEISWVPGRAKFTKLPSTVSTFLCQSLLYLFSKYTQSLKSQSEILHVMYSRHQEKKKKKKNQQHRRLPYRFQKLKISIIYKGVRWIELMELRGTSSHKFQVNVLRVIAEITFSDIQHQHPNRSCL